MNKLWRLVFVLSFIVMFTGISFADGVTPTVVNLIAGSGLKAKGAVDVGDVTVWNDANNLYVEYTTSLPWCMLETHLQPATSLTAIPQSKGNPAPGHFLYNGTGSCIKDVTYTIPRTWDYGTQLIIAAQAKVTNGTLTTEGAWGWDGNANNKFPGKNWATYFNYTLQSPAEECHSPFETGGPMTVADCSDLPNNQAWCLNFFCTGKMAFCCEETWDSDCVWEFNYCLDYIYEGEGK
jgi:hypothetical protein